MERAQNKHGRRLFTVLFMTAAIVSLMPTALLAAADVTISPTRVVFDGHSRKAQVSLINNSNKAKTYRISWSRKRLTESGQYEEIETARPGERFSDSMVRYSPRQITLPPGKPQAVRLLLRKPADMDAGEYRSYLKFSAIPDSDEFSIEKTLNPGSKTVSIRLKAISSISIPVIVRHGKTQGTASISDMSLDQDNKGQPQLTLTLELSGNRSLYGDIEARFIPADGGEALLVGQHKGVAVYPPLGRRHYHLPLRLPRGQQLRKGNIEVSFRGSEDDNRNRILANASLPVR